MGWVKLVPRLKIRSIAAHYLHQSLNTMDETAVVPYLEEDIAAALFMTLNRSRDIAENAGKNEDLAHAFQEAALSQWGEEDEMGEDALVNIAKFANSQASAVFFLTQTAGATHAVIRLLSALFEYDRRGSNMASENEWDRETFAAPYLLGVIQDVLTKFVESEAKEGHRVDPNVWRNTTESGVKVALYCTSFASVVVGLLKAMLTFDSIHFERHKGTFFPMICRLVPVQSEEIRTLVQRILLEKFGPIIAP